MEYPQNDSSTTQTITTAASAELLKDFERVIFVFVNRIVFCTLIGLFGMLSNGVNICVFIKQGLNTSMNISFLAMAVSDLFRIVTVQWMNVCSNPYIDSVAIDVINAIGLIPEYASVYFDWKFVPAKNKTLLSLAFRSTRPQTKGIAFTIHAALLVIALMTVTLFTGVFVLQLKKHSRWKQNNLKCDSQRSSITSREKKTVKMVVTIATLMITCYSPAVILSLVSAIVTDFSVSGEQVNLFHSMWSFGFLLGIVNASSNIFIYYNMSSSYRGTFRQLFYNFRKDKTNFHEMSSS